MKSLYLFFISIIIVTTGALAQTTPGNSIQSFPGWGTTAAFPPDSTIALALQMGISSDVTGEGYVFTRPVRNPDGTVSASSVVVWIKFTDGTLLEFIPDEIIKGMDENSRHNLLAAVMGTPINYAAVFYKPVKKDNAGRETSNYDVPVKVKIQQKVEFTHGFQSAAVIKRYLVL